MQLLAIAAAVAIRLALFAILTSVPYQVGAASSTIVPEPTQFATDTFHMLSSFLIVPHHVGLGNGIEPEIGFGHVLQLCAA
jgi:hypothetical protein